MSKPIKDKKVLIIYSDQDNEHSIIIESCQQVIALAGMSSEKCLYENIVPPPEKVVRYPRVAGEEWEVINEEKLRLKLNSFDSYIFISLSDKTAGLALWALTLRGAENIYGNKPVVVIDPAKLLQDNALPDILKLLNDSRDSGRERIVYPKDANISSLFARLMNEVSHGGESKANNLSLLSAPNLPESAAEPDDLPQYLKTIYLLVADDKLADKEKYLNRFAGILKTAVSHLDAFRGWSVEVRGEKDAKKVLQHVQLRPVDLILLDCDFQGDNDNPEWDAESPVAVDAFMFDGRYVGLQLHKYLKRTKVAKIDGVNNSPVINFDTVLFTSYERKKIDIATKDTDIGELTDISIGDNGELISYLQKEDPHALQWILAKLIQAKNRIISLWATKTSATNTPQYELAFRYFGFKFAHHDWLPLDMHCIPFDGGEGNSHKNELFRIPGWIVREGKPENIENGLCFSFPINRTTENLNIAHTYVGATIAKVLKEFIGLLSSNRERATVSKITIHNSDKCNIPVDKAYDVARKQISLNLPQKAKSSYVFGCESFSSPLWLAAVPLTGSTMPGDWDKVRSHFISKIECYLEMGFGAAVLKTVYPVSESKGTWPGADKSMYQENQSRCYKDGKSDKATFYNTGSTANEAFSPTLFNDVLHRFGGNPKIITSLGAHENDKDVWHTLFSEVFNKIDTAWYPLVEINVRHALRTISKKCGLNGDEYFHPLTNDPVQALARLPEFYRAFREWVVTVASIANEHSKKLIFKFTYRTDLFVLLGICEELKKTHKHIVGVTLINTFKSPSFLDPKESGPDMKMDGWFDIIKHPQVSGAALAPLRNYLLDVLQDKAFTPNGFTLDISASGGVMSKDDVSQCLALGAKSVQIGTALLQGITGLPNYMQGLIEATVGVSPGSGPTHGNIYKRNRDVAETVSGPGGKFAFERFVKRRVDFEIARCQRCGICYSSTYCDAYLNRLYINNDKLTEIDSANLYDLKYPVIHKDACVGCGLCVQLCPYGALNLVIPENKPALGGGYIEDNGTIAHFRGKQKNPMRLVLASSSPRRIQILKELGYEFHPITPTFVEKTQDEITSAKELVKFNAEGKALEIANLLLCDSINELDKQWQNNKSLKALRKTADRCVVVACDTLIVLGEKDEEVIGKPHNSDTAIKTLTRLSGKPHQVITGICVINCAHKDNLTPISDLVETKVTFRTLDEEQIKKYVETGEPLDKAGAYAIQGRGELFIEKIEGSYSNVVGLPKERLEAMLTIQTTD